MINKTGFWIALVLCLMLSTLFFIFPQIDLTTSALFFHFSAFKSVAWMEAARTTLYFVTYGLIAVLLMLTVWYLFAKKYSSLKPILYLLLCFVLGPGLVVNVILKDHWHRPRPHSIVQFGGHETYQKPWVIGKQKGFSFVAGEPSTAFAFFAFLALINKKRWQYMLAGLLTLNWLLFSYIRLALGAHFLSDILIGATLIYMITYGCYALTLQRHSR